jgi:DNA-3-methyladenine glycosylase II
MSTPRHTALLAAVSPFELRPALRALAGFAPCAGEQVISGDLVRKAFALPDDPDRAVVAQVGPRADGRAGVSLAVFADRALHAGEARAVERAVSDWLSLADDLTGFLAVARADDAMAPVLAETAGLHQVRFPSLAEGACYFVLTQRTSQRVAGVRKRRLAAEHGPRLTVDGTGYVAFPALERLVRLGPDELARYAGNPRQTEYLTAVVHGLAALDEEWLRTAPYEEAFAALRGLHGVGEYTASAIMFRVLGRPDRLPLVMPQFTDLIDRLYGGGVRPADVAARYGRYQGWWSYYARTALGWQGNPRVA